MAERIVNSSEREAGGAMASDGETSRSPAIASASSNSARGGGEPLPESERAYLEESLGTDFSQVRLHTDAEAARDAKNLNALAFTENQDIAFAAHQYQPGTTEGQKLLAHELTHVAQQATGEVVGVQRAPDPTQPAQPAPADQPPATQPPATADAGAQQQPGTALPTNEFFARSEVENIRARATVRYGQTSATVGAGVSAINSIKESLMRVSSKYTEAYQSYADAVTAAGKEARNQQTWFDFFMGVGVGVTVGLLSEAIFVAEGAALATEMIVEVGAEAAEGGIGIGLKASGLTEFVGQDLAPSIKLDPMVLELEIYRLLESLHQRVHSVAQCGDAQFLINGAAEYAIGEIKSHVAGGEQEMSENDLLDLIETLVRADQSSKTLDKTMPSFRVSLQGLVNSVSSAPDTSVWEMEQDIWIMWIATIKKSDSNILDYDAIEDRLHKIGVLGEGSRLGVDFGWYTSEADELAALSAAKDQAPEIRRKNKDLTSEE